jgi:hypothetical protein
MLCLAPKPSQDWADPCRGTCGLITTNGLVLEPNSKDSGVKNIQSIPIQSCSNLLPYKQQVNWAARLVGAVQTRGVQHKNLRMTNWSAISIPAQKKRIRYKASGWTEVHNPRNDYPDSIAIRKKTRGPTERHQQSIQARGRLADAYPQQ